MKHVDGFLQHTNVSADKTRVAILANILTPYRLPIYKVMAEHFKIKLLLGTPEDNRQWSLSISESSQLEVKRAWGMSFKRKIKDADGNIVDLRYTHFNPGYIYDLFRFHPDAVISTEMGIRSLFALLYGFVFRIPVWVWWGGTLHTERSRSLSKRIIRQHFFARFVRHWISYGSSSTAYLKSLGIPENQILEIQNCVDESVFGTPANAFPIDLPYPRVLVVGQLIGRKGIFEFLKAASTVQHEGIPLSLLFVGNGPEAEHLRCEAQRLGIKKIQIIEYLPPNEMVSVYKAADLLVFPTLEDVWGLVVNEALLAGLPVIASRYAGCAEELLPPENIFDPLNHRDFVLTLRRALNGQLAAPSTSKIKTIGDVSRMIINDIKAHLGTNA